MMNTKNDFKEYLRILFYFIWGFFAIVCGASSMNELEGFHTVCGIGLLACTGYGIYLAVKAAKKPKDK